VRPGEVGFGEVRLGQVRYGVAWLSKVWSGFSGEKFLFDMVRQGGVMRGMVRSG
jgi:hypothetical protein